MARKHLFVVFSLLLLISIAILLIFRPEGTTILFQQAFLSSEDQAERVRLRLHPLTSAEKRAAAEKNLVKTWDEWVEQTVEIGLGKEIEDNPNLNTPEEVRGERAFRLGKAAWLRKQFEELQMPHPAYPTWPSPKQLAKLDRMRFPSYQGAQTPEALIAEFDEAFLQSYPQSVDWDTRYPKQKWIQSLLEKGAHFKNASDYSYYLQLRRDLLEKQHQPDEWRSGKYGIPITTDFQEYENGFIERKIWENRMLRKVSAENTNTPLTTIFFPSNYPDKYLPVIGKMTYIRRGEGSSLKTWGTTLTQEQRDDLLYRGKHPEDIEIVYIDGSYNLLSEPPKPYNREQWIQENAYITEMDGIPLTPGNYEDVLGQPMPERWKKWYETEHATRNQGIVSAPDTETLRAAARDAMKTEQTRFQQGLRELERFVNMSDAEFEAELQRRFTPQLPELPTIQRLENQLWSEAQSARMTPARFQAALKILEKYGSEEGMRKLRQADPKAAAEVKQILGGAATPGESSQPLMKSKPEDQRRPPRPNAP